MHDYKEPSSELVSYPREETFSKRRWVNKQIEKNEFEKKLELASF